MISRFALLTFTLTYSLSVINTGMLKGVAAGQHLLTASGTHGTCALTSNGPGPGRVIELDWDTSVPSHENARIFSRLILHETIPRIRYWPHAILNSIRKVTHSVD